ncbi:aldehyde dehydrogenase family 16 member A1 [Chanos chanos]|uniref:Aldehyde dehydrogenase family 16 member A1 n=1 Tax=Chanos chanos TaxID=29144 RepID=A0A6J2WYB5_CHACN|nr:aldehyde dehydrogenase family 16 member A1 [Chanos chanos]XP_030649310.1 aldehyde dehydrogenase family 16 member A1 [Chanos chanos]
MAGSTTKTVHDIFQSMEYGPSSSSSSTAQSWLDQHSRSLGLFIDGKFVSPTGRQSRTVTDATGGSVCTTVCATEDDISASMSSATSAYKAWNDLSCYQRAKVFLRLASVLQKHSQCVSELCELSQSPTSPATLVRLAQYYAGWAQIRDTSMPDWTPRGVVAVVGSDDCSLYSLWLKAIPALAMGNAVTVIPGVATALPSLLLAQLFVEAGLPSGVLSVLTGSDMSLGAQVAQNSQVNYLTYSGNKQDGEMLAKQTAGWGVPVSYSLSLSSVCPLIIFESADIDSAVDGVIETAFKKKREWRWVLCVQESVWDSVVARLRLRMTGMKSVPLLANSDRAVVDAAVQEAQQQGATLIQSCTPPPSGSAYPPTVLCGVAPSCACVVSPPPGPVLPLLSFRSNAEGVTLGNHSPHGQAASIWTEDLTLALECAKSLSVGSVWVNSHSIADPSLPLSGRKESGTSTDGGREGLYQFLRPTQSPPLPRSTPSSVDYSSFGSAESRASIPEGADPSSIPRSYQQFVGGQQKKADSGCTKSVSGPGGAVLAYCPDGGRKDVRNAVEAAAKVQPGWMKKSPSARAQSLYSLANNLEKRGRDIATSIHKQTGLSLEEASKEVELSVFRLYDLAAWCDKERGGVQLLPQSGSALSIPEAIGVVGVILPDRKPILSLVSLLGAAVAVGNAVVMVPSEKYPLPSLEFIQVLVDSDLPAGVVSVITGGRDQLTHALANHSVIQAIWYWGSKEGCQFLQHSCCSPLKRLWLHSEEEEEKQGGGRDWTHPSLLEEIWREAVVWKSLWIPTA